MAPTPVDRTDQRTGTGRALFLFSTARSDSTGSRGRSLRLESVDAFSPPGSALKRHAGPTPSPIWTRRCV